MDDNAYLKKYKNYKQNYKQKYLQMKNPNNRFPGGPIIINKEILKEALQFYEKYVMIRLCTTRINYNFDHELWLPVEIWNVIIDTIKDDIEAMDIYERNRYNERLTLKLLNKHKERLLCESINIKILREAWGLNISY